MPVLILIIIALLSVTAPPVFAGGNNLSDITGLTSAESTALNRLDSVFGHNASPATLYRNMTDDDQMYDATMIVMDIRKRWNEWSPAFREIASGYFLSKRESAGNQSARTLMKSAGIVRGSHLLPNWIETAHFNIEWGNSLLYSDTGMDSGQVISCSQAFNNGSSCSGIPDFVDKWADYLEEVWAIETLQLGYINPAGTETYLYDVYIANTRDSITGNADDLTPALAYNYLGLTVTYCDRDYYQICKDDNIRDAYSYIVINNSYPDEQTMNITAAHEFFHAIQFSYPSIDDWWFSPDNHWWIEATATWMEEVAYDESNHYYPRVWSWLRSPELSLKNNGTSYAGHEYGDVIFVLYLTDVYLKNRDFVRNVWESGSSGIETLGSVLAADKYGRVDFESAFRGFVALNAVADTDEVYGGYEEGRLYGRAAVTRKHDAYPAAASITRYSAPHELGATYIQFLPDGNDNNGLTIEFDGTDDVNWATMLVKVRSDGTGYDRDDLSLDPEFKTGCHSVDGFGSVYSEVFLVASVFIEPSLSDTAPYSYSAAPGSICPDTSMQAFSAARITDDPPVYDGGSDKRCFIASVAFGSSDSPYVRLLRNFRDQYLMSSHYGRMFVAIYYSFSPNVANFLEIHPPAPVIVRFALFPLVGMAYLFLHVSLFSMIASVSALLSVLRMIKNASKTHSNN